SDPNSPPSCVSPLGLFLLWCHEEGAMVQNLTCFYISQRDQGDSNSGTAAEAVYETLVAPAMERFPEFDITSVDYTHEPGSISAVNLKAIVEADLVIADLTELSPSGYYQLGARQAAQRPVVVIAEDDYVMAVAGDDLPFVRYPFSRSPSIAGDA